MKTRTKNHAKQDKTNVQWVSPDDKPHYGVEALIATISDERELLKALKKAIKHNSEFAKKRTSQKHVPADP